MDSGSQRWGSGGMPTRMDQVVPFFANRDAIGAHTLHVQDILHEMGIESSIYAGGWLPEVKHLVKPVDRLKSSSTGDSWILYQFSIGSPLFNAVASYPGSKVIDYHNITPAELIEPWEPLVGEEVRIGRQQLANLAPYVRGALGDSSYNVKELIAAGYSSTAVAPLLVDLSSFDAEEDSRLARRLREERQRGGCDWLFVGKVSPHKAQHDIVKALAVYRKVYDPQARLHLVGGELSPRYGQALRAYIARLGLTDVVELAGSVSQSALATYYANVDVFVSCSEHEGFCAPILEAMYHRLPVVAYAVAAVPETVEDAGILLKDKSPAVVAAAVHKVLTDEQLRSSLSDQAARRAKELDLSVSKGKFRQALEALFQQR